MASDTHNVEAQARDTEVAALHPDAERRHVRATLPARVVLRDVEKQEDDRELKLVGESYLTVVVVDGSIEFYAGSDPVWNAGTIETSRIVGVESGHEFDYTPPRVNPTLRLQLAEEGTTPLDIDLEVFTFDDSELHQTTDIEADLAWWRSAVGR